MRKHQGVETFRSCRITDSVLAMGTGCAQVIASVDNPDPGTRGPSQGSNHRFHFFIKGRTVAMSPVVLDAQEMVRPQAQKRGSSMGIGLFTVSG
jgi:hypothetical protein